MAAMILDSPLPLPLPRVKELDNLNLNFVSGISGTFTQDLLQHLIKKDAVHKAFIKRKKEGLKAR